MSLTPRGSSFRKFGGDLIGTRSDGFLVDFQTVIVVELTTKYLEVGRRLLLSTSFPVNSKSKANPVTGREGP
jgi:hypothetical protein